MPDRRDVSTAIREARPSDAEVLAALNKEFNGVVRGAGQLRESLATSGSRETVLVAEDAGMVVGFACLQIHHSVCYDAPWTEITELYVTPDSRGRGVGRALVRELDIRARAMGASELVVRTSIGNEAAKAVFRHAGLNTASHVVFRRSYAAEAD